MDPRDQALEEARLADEDVDHVDAAVLVGVLLPRNLDQQRLDRARRIGEEDVLVGGDEPEGARDEREHDEQEEERAGFSSNT